MAPSRCAATGAHLVLRRRIVQLVDLLHIAERLLVQAHGLQRLCPPQQRLLVVGRHIQRAGALVDRLLVPSHAMKPPHQHGLQHARMQPRMVAWRFSIDVTCGMAAAHSCMQLQDIMK